MSCGWTTVAALAAVCYLLRAGAPFALRSRSLPPAVSRRLDDAAPAVLAALVAVQLFGRGRGWAVDARVLGVAAAAAVYLWRRSLVLAFVAAAAVTAGVRLA